MFLVCLLLLMSLLLVTFMQLLASLLLLFFSNAPGISAFVDVPSVAKTPAVASLIMLLPVCHVPGLSAVVGLT